MVHRCHIYMYIRWPIWPPTPLLEWVKRPGDKPREKCSWFLLESFTQWSLDTNSFVCLIIGKPNTNSLPRPSSRWDFEKKLFLFPSELFMAFLTWQPCIEASLQSSKVLEVVQRWLSLVTIPEKNLKSSFPKGENMPLEIRKLVNVFLWRFFKLRQVCINLS